MRYVNYKVIIIIIIRDQAAKLEKIRDYATNFATFLNANLKGSQINEVEYAPTHASKASNLHNVSSQHVTMGSVSHECSQNNYINSTSIPGILPKYTSFNKPSTCISMGTKKRWEYNLHHGHENIKSL